MTTAVTVEVAGHQVKVTQTNNPDNPTTLGTQGQRSTFHVHSGTSLVIEELAEKSTPAIDQVEVGGKARQLTDEDFRQIGQSPGVKE